MFEARAFGTRAATALAERRQGRILTASAIACNLLTDAQRVVCLVARAVGEGPLNIVVEADSLPPVAPGARFAVSERELALGPIRVSLEGAASWDGAHSRTLLEQARQRLASEPGVCSQLRDEAQAILERKRCAMILPQHASPWIAVLASDDEPTLERSVLPLIGLGPGLTPAGDDWLAGWLLGLWVVDAAMALRAGQTVVRAATGRTNCLSLACLECAAAGEADAGWINLFAALAETTAGRSRVQAAAQRVLERGATSGAAMLMGFCSGALTSPSSEVQA
jgi:hypothetical protein